MADHPKRPPTPAVVAPLLRGRFGVPYLWHPECGSTQDVLRGAGLPEGAVAATDHQTAGRGRRAARSWVDEPGTALLFSLLLRPPPETPVAELSLVCALAVAESVEEAAALEALVKWPNDVLVEGRKVAGILLEGGDGAVVCGIGVNVDQSREALPPDARTPAASLRMLTGRDQDRAALLVDLLERLEAHYDVWLASGLARLLPSLERRDALRGREVTVGHVTGAAAGIASDGRLRVRGADGTATLVASGEVEERRVPG